MANIGKMAAQMTLDSVGFEKSAAKVTSAMQRMEQQMNSLKKIGSAFGGLELLAKGRQAWDVIIKATEGTEVGERLRKLDEQFAAVKNSVAQTAGSVIDKMNPALTAGAKNLELMARMAEQAIDTLARLATLGKEDKGGFKLEWLVRLPAADKVEKALFPKKAEPGQSVKGLTGFATMTEDAKRIQKLMDEMERSVESKRLDALGIGPNVRKVLEEAPRTSTDEFNKLVEAAELADKKIAQIAERMEKMKAAGKEFVEGVTAPIKAIMERSKLRVEQEGGFKDEVGRAMEIANRLTEFKTPSAIMEGSTEAFSAINRFQSQGTGRASAEDIKKILEEQRNLEKEHKRQLDEIIKQLKDAGVPVVSI